MLPLSGDSQSVRNADLRQKQAPWKIEEVQLGDLMACVVVPLGDNLIESAITRRSAD